MNSNRIGSDVIGSVDTPRAVPAPRVQGGQLSELACLRQELALERERRRRAEASAAAAELRALAAEERAASAEWLVNLLRGELMGDEEPRRPWSPWLPWHRR